MPSNIWKQVLTLIFLILAFNYLYVALAPRKPESSTPLSYSRFKQELQKDNLKEITIQGNAVSGKFKEPVEVVPLDSTAPARHFDQFTTTLPPFPDPQLMEELEARGTEVNVKPPEEPSPWATALIYLLPWVLIIGVWWFILRGMRAGGPGGASGGVAKSGARLYSKENSQVTFDDVAGLEEAKQELMEIVEFLRNPKKFARIGGKVPRGVLLVGPPGTGKTLMARAVAGEAGVPFFSIAASQFIEMFVGVGASRVRDLFETAKKRAEHHLHRRAGCRRPLPGHRFRRRQR
jgi:cell division protease FtsH